tara:strand:+ start:3299 stop:4309 length:1011 start_codon:yes stop_codon:yes gene_type:complete
VETTNTEALSNPEGTIEGALDAMYEPEAEELTEEEVVEPTTPEAEYEEEEGDDEQDPEEPEEDEGEADEEQDSSEDDEAEDAADSQREQQSFTVKVDGTNTVVTLDELKQSYSGQKYIQQGMQETAEVKREAETVYSALLQERQAIAQLYEQARNGDVPTAPKQPSRELFETDPIGYMNAKLAYEDQVADYSREMQKLEVVTQQQSQAQRAAQQAYMRQELDSLKKAIPEMQDAKQMPVFREKLVKAGTDIYGYSTEEISEVMDHRAIRVLMDAAKYQDIVNGTEKAAERARPKSRNRTLKAGSKKQGAKSVAQKKQRNTLAKTGSVEDAIALLIN